MSSASNPPQVPDRDNLPLKKRDQRWNLPPPQQHHRQYDDASFKAPYSDKSQAETCLKQTCPLPKWVPALYQPWMHTYTATRSIPQVLSAFREHQGWTGWRESNPLHVGWDFSHPFQHRNNLSGMLTCQTGHHHPSRFSTRSVNSEGLQSIDGRHDSEQGKTLRDKNLNTQLQINGRSRGPYLKRSRKTEYFPKVSRSPLSSSSPRSAHEVLQVHKPPKPVRQLISGHSFMRYSKPSNTYISMRDKESRSSLLTSSQQDSFSSRTPYHLPSLPPHFVVGSLIELRDGRLRKVEHLQTEDFLLGSLARPDLRLSCCTVQSITPSASSSSISRLLILLHDQQSQELVDVYVEYPFFVQGQGWSSCSPQKTARLCGLQCCQLRVGDVCLALTPVSGSQQPLPATLEPETPMNSDLGCESPAAAIDHVLPGPGQPAGGQMKEMIRRRHQSAPELRGSEINM